MDKYIWYVCYGSNLLYDRFLCYLTGEGLDKYHLEPDNTPCPNQTPPKETRVIGIPHNIYFALSSTTWRGGGVCFLNDTRPGNCVGRAYLITEEQFNFVKKKEGSKYTKLVRLDDIDGIEAYTFTHEEYAKPRNLPNRIYMKIIRDGLVECGFEKPWATRYIKKYLHYQHLYFPTKRDGHDKSWEELTLAQKRHRLHAVLISQRVGFWLFCGKECQHYYEGLTFTEENINEIKDEIINVYKETLEKAGVKNIEERMDHIHRRID